MKNGRLQYDFVRDLSSHMRNLSSHHIIAEKVADDHQVQVLQLRTKCIKSESCKHQAKV